MKTTNLEVGTIHKSNNYGYFKITKYNSAQDIEIEFVDTGFKMVARACHIRIGNVKDKLCPSVCMVGFPGDGDFAPNKYRVAYQTWCGMLERCYDEKCQEKKPTYKGCVVCEEWHNFQIFAAWYYDNYPKDGGKYQLDKDLSCYGERGKLYSPETCVFVTAQVNTEEAHSKSYKFKNPEGEVVDIYNLAKFCRENGLDQGTMWHVFNGREKSYKGWTKPS